MNMQLPVIAGLLFIFLISGVSADNLLTMDNSFTELWNNGNVRLPDPGVLEIPQGPGIITTTVIQEPFRYAGEPEGPDQVQYINTGNPDANTAPGLLLGDTYYQKEAVLKSGKAISDGLPLTTVSRYYTNSREKNSRSVQILPLIMKNTNHQLPNRVRFSATWQPLPVNRVSEIGCDVEGTWKTNRGNITLTNSPFAYDRIAVTGTYASGKGVSEGTHDGPVLTGTWTEPGSALGDKTGRFTYLFREDCCSFTGTWGTGESDTNGGEWSGIRG